VSQTTNPDDRSSRPTDFNQRTRRGLNYRPVNWLLLVPLVGTLVPYFYNYTSPSLGGLPFFYWYQMLWIPISVGFTWIVFRSTRGER
jgi:hypothetical protein